MTKEQANKTLYFVGFFALLSLLSIVLTMPYVWRFVVINPLILWYSIVGNIILILLVIAPFKKMNLILFTVPVLAYLENLFSSIEGLYEYFNRSAILVKIGIVPGIFTEVVYVFTNVIGLIVLALRIYGYIREHRHGLNTKF